MTGFGGIAGVDEGLRVANGVDNGGFYLLVGEVDVQVMFPTCDVLRSQRRLPELQNVVAFGGRVAHLVEMDGEVVNGVAPQGEFPVQEVTRPILDDHVLAMDVGVDAHQWPPGERDPGRFDIPERVGGKAESQELRAVLVPIGRVDLLGQLGQAPTEGDRVVTVRPVRRDGWELIARDGGEFGEKPYDIGRNMRRDGDTAGSNRIKD